MGLELIFGVLSMLYVVSIAAIGITVDHMVSKKRYWSVVIVTLLGLTGTSLLGLLLFETAGVVFLTASPMGLDAVVAMAALLIYAAFLISRNMSRYPLYLRRS